MLGFELTENFNYPYLSRSVGEFWRRWHISLTSWFREYLYFPLGGNRKGKVRTYINISIIFIATGLWHGASWDLSAGGFSMDFYGPGTSGAWENTGKTKVVKHIYTIWCCVWAGPSSGVGDVGLTLQYLKRMFLPWMYTASGYAVQELVTNRAFFLWLPAVFWAAACCRKRRLRSCPDGKFKNSTVELIFCMLLLVYSVMLMVSSTYSAFYFT